MSSLKDKLLKIKELLEKGMKNGGLGGPGSVKAGAVLPSINKMPKPGNNSATPSVSVAQPSKKNPIKQAQQTQNKDIKDIKMKEAQAKLNLQKEEVKVAPEGSKNRETYEKEFVKFEDNGQWSVQKSGYKGYTDADNARRKANNLGEDTGIHTMNRIKQYGGSGPDAAAREAKKMRAKSKKNPVKIYSKEEIAEINAKRNSQKD